MTTYTPAQAGERKEKQGPKHPVAGPASTGRTRLPSEYRSLSIRFHVLACNVYLAGVFRLARDLVAIVSAGAIRRLFIESLPDGTLPRQRPERVCFVDAFVWLIRTDRLAISDPARGTERRSLFLRMVLA